MKDNDFTEIFNTNQITHQVLEKETDLNKLKNITFDPFSQYSDMTESEDLSYYNVIKNDIEKCEYYIEDKFKSETSSRFSEKSHSSLFHLITRSLLNKVDDLHQYLTELKYKFSVKRGFTMTVRH